MIFIEPTDKDILLGRTKRSFNHPGNKIFRSRINESVPQYLNATTRLDKIIVIQSLVDGITAQGGRFLKLDCSKHWVDVSDGTITRDKVSHAVRDAANKWRLSSSSSSSSSHRSPLPFFIGTDERSLNATPVLVSLLHRHSALLEDKTLPTNSSADDHHGGLLLSRPEEKHQTLQDMLDFPSTVDPSILLSAMDNCLAPRFSEDAMSFCDLGSIASILSEDDDYDDDDLLEPVNSNHHQFTCDMLQLALDVCNRTDTKDVSTNFLPSALDVFYFDRRD
jgi:hypothetical protein